MKKMTNMQIGKNGLTENFLSSLKIAFKTHTIIKIKVLKNKEKTNEIAEKIVSELGKKYTYRILGFTIITRKWRKNRR